jgi:hypothetical protein
MAFYKFQKWKNLRGKTQHAFAGACAKLRKATVSFSVCPSVRPSIHPSVCLSVRLSVRPHTTTRVPLDGLPLNFLFECFRKSVEKFKFLCNMSRITGTLHEDLNTFIVISCSVLLRIRNVSDKCCRKSPNTLFMLNNFLFSKTVLFMR